MQGKGRNGVEKVKERSRGRGMVQGRGGWGAVKGEPCRKGRHGPHELHSRSIPVPFPQSRGIPAPRAPSGRGQPLRPRPRAVPAPLLPPWPRPLPPGHAPEPTKLSLPLWPRSLRLYAPPSAHRSPAAARLGHAPFALRPRPPLPPRLPVVPRVGRALTWPHRAAILCSRADRGRGERAPSGTLRAQPDPRPAAPDDAGGFVDSFFFFPPFEPFFFPRPARRAARPPASRGLGAEGRRRRALRKRGRAVISFTFLLIPSHSILSLLIPFPLAEPEASESGVAPFFPPSPHLWGGFGGGGGVGLFPSRPVGGMGWEKGVG